MNQIQPPPPNKRSYWVDENLMAGFYPAEDDYRGTYLKLRGYLRAGVQCFIDLTEPGERRFTKTRDELQPYQQTLEDVGADLGIDVVYKRFDIVDVSIPTVEEMDRILTAIQVAQQRGMKVYVHCRGGFGRTGTVVGCYLREQGFSSQGALDRINELRRGLEKESYASPEAWTQIEFVKRWTTPGWDQDTLFAEDTKWWNNQGNFLHNTADQQDLPWWLQEEERLNGVDDTPPLWYSPETEEKTEQETGTARTPFSHAYAYFEAMLWDVQN